LLSLGSLLFIDIDSSEELSERMADPLAQTDVSELLSSSDWHTDAETDSLSDV